MANYKVYEPVSHVKPVFYIDVENRQGI